MANCGEGNLRLYKDDVSKKKGEINYAQNRIVDTEYSWCNRWKTGNPWSGLTIFENESGKKIGHVIIGDGELAYMLVPEAWGKGYGTEAISAIAPFLISQDFKLPIDVIQPSCDIKNVPSIKSSGEIRLK